MLAIPAIDLRRGMCVRLRQGRAEEETVYSDNPLKTAQKFVSAGAQALHIVDLDGAFLQKGGSPNVEVIRDICRQISIPIQVGGGLRTAHAIESMLAFGVDQVVVTTMAVYHPEGLKKVLHKHRDRIQLGADVHEGMVAALGWTEKTHQSAVEFALYWKDFGIDRIVFTDISRDGMLSGPNIEAIVALAKGTGMHITASGGVRNKEDLKQLSLLETLGVDKAIVGKALYTGDVTLEELREYSKKLLS